MRPYFVVELTPRCNNDCTYCYNVWKQCDYPTGELSGPDFVDLLDRLVEETEPEGITLSGGEPLLHPDVCDIASFLARRNIRTGIATNGILLDETMTRKLVDSGVGYFEISLVSTDDGSYGRLTRDDRLGEVRRAILNVKKLRARLTVSFVATRLNMSDVEDVIELCFAFSVDAIALNRFVPGGRGLEHRSSLQLTDEELRTVLRRADGKSREHGIPVNVTIPVEPCIIDHEQYPGLNFGTCVCGTGKWVVDPVGNLRTCEQNPEILGSLLDSGFGELSALEGADAFRRDHLKPECNGCDLLHSCGGGCRFTRNTPSPRKE
ncbi:MAG: radical SAM protein [Deltaproteobacteria bacterium]|nr:radical SAM protein [Deltaproteobacteria bacterium]